MNQRTLILTVLFAVSYLLTFGQNASTTVIKMSVNNPSIATTANTPTDKNGLYVRQVNTTPTSPSVTWYNDVQVTNGGIKFMLSLSGIAKGYWLSPRTYAKEFTISTLDNLTTLFKVDALGISYFPVNLTMFGGTKVPADACLAVNGDLYARSLRIDAATWPDYVFATDYKCMNISDLELFIKRHKHLPEIPSAEDIEKKGIDVAQTDKLLLQKVEELSLYIIEQQKRIEKQQKRIEELEK